MEVWCHDMTAPHFHPNLDLELEPLTNLEFHSRRGKARSLVRTVTEGLVRRMPATAQANPRFLDQFFASIRMANRVRTVGVNADGAILVDDELHVRSLPREQEREEREK